VQGKDVPISHLAWYRSHTITHSGHKNTLNYLLHLRFSAQENNELLATCLKWNQEENSRWYSGIEVIINEALPNKSAENIDYADAGNIVEHYKSDFYNLIKNKLNIGKTDENTEQKTSQGKFKLLSNLSNRGSQDVWKPERYLMDWPIYRTKILLNFRASNHWLAVERGRYRGIPRHQRTCPCCPGKVEDEYHLLTCSHPRNVDFQNLIIAKNIPGEGEAQETDLDKMARRFQNYHNELNKGSLVIFNFLQPITNTYNKFPNQTSRFTNNYHVVTQ